MRSELLKLAKTLSASGYKFESKNVLSVLKTAQDTGDTEGDVENVTEEFDFEFAPGDVEIVDEEFDFEFAPGDVEIVDEELVEEVSTSEARNPSDGFWYGKDGWGHYFWNPDEKVIYGIKNGGNLVKVRENSGRNKGFYAVIVDNTNWSEVK